MLIVILLVLLAKFLVVGSSCNDTLLTNLNIVLGGSVSNYLDSINHNFVILTGNATPTIPHLGSTSAWIFDLHLNSNSNRVTIPLSPDGAKAYYIRRIGIQQHFNTSTAMANCIDSSRKDKFSKMKIYSVINSKEVLVTYPSGNTIGTFHLPYDYSDVAVDYITIPGVLMQSITIEKFAVPGSDNMGLLNSGSYCLQFEVYGCEATEVQSPRKLFEYRTPKLLGRGDPSYTGLCGDNGCEGGLGILTDGSIELDSSGDDFIQMQGVPSSGICNLSTSSSDISIRLNEAVYISYIKIYGIWRNGWTDPSSIALSVNGKSDSIVPFENAGVYILFAYVGLASNQLLIQFKSNLGSRIGLSEIQLFDAMERNIATMDIEMTDNKVMEFPSYLVVIVCFSIILSLSLVANIIMSSIAIVKCMKKRLKPKLNENKTKDSNSLYNDYSTVQEVAAYVANGDTLPSRYDSKTNMDNQKFADDILSARHQSVITLCDNPVYFCSKKENSEEPPKKGASHLADIPASPVKKPENYDILSYSSDNGNSSLSKFDTTNTTSISASSSGISCNDSTTTNNNNNNNNNNNKNNNDDDDNNNNNNNIKKIPYNRMNSTQRRDSFLKGLSELK